MWPRAAVVLQCLVTLVACGAGAPADADSGASTADLDAGVVDAGVVNSMDAAVADAGAVNSRDAGVDAGVAMDAGVADAGGVSSMDAGVIGDYRRVFVTSTTYSGNLGGLPGADAKCQTRAQAAGLSGTYKAWLSTADPNGSPATRFARATVPYRLVNGVLIANDWSDLVDGRLSAPIDRTELGTPPPPTAAPCTTTTPQAVVFTATRVTGEALPAGVDQTCAAWTSGTGLASFGSTGTNLAPWTAGCSGGCSFVAALFCFEQ